jgi:hypothetical protein
MFHGSQWSQCFYTQARTRAPHTHANAHTQPIRWSSRNGQSGAIRWKVGIFCSIWQMFHSLCNQANWNPGPIHTNPAKCKNALPQWKWSPSTLSFSYSFRNVLHPRSRYFNKQLSWLRNSATPLCLDYRRAIRWYIQLISWLIIFDPILPRNAAPSTVWTVVFRVFYHHLRTLSSLQPWASVWFEMCWGQRRIRKCIFRGPGYNEDALFFLSWVPVMKGSDIRHTHVANY